MPSRIYSCALRGMEAYGVEIEVDLLNGLSCFTVVGLGDTAVQESRERVRSAIVNSGASFPTQRKVVNLAPADVKKCGPAFDLPIAVGLLLASEQLGKGGARRGGDAGCDESGMSAIANTSSGARHHEVKGRPHESIFDDAIFIGELALNGELRAVPGLISCALWAREQGFSTLFIPRANAEEAGLVSEGLTLYAVETLHELIEHLEGRNVLQPWQGRSWQAVVSAAEGEGLSSGAGARAGGSLCLEGGPFRERALRALSVAAAGGHHVMMYGPPGSGKTLLAEVLPSLLPPLSEEEQLELMQLYSVAGYLTQEQLVRTSRPFRSVHSSASAAAVFGGGSQVRPGEISLAHRGVLFLDEVLEFPRALLEGLRQPLEERSVVVSRAAGTVRFPSHFILVAAMNPCPCGYFGDERKKCRCTTLQRMKYQERLSGPLLDRIDLLIELPRLSFTETRAPRSFSLIALRDQVLRARLMQKKRLGETLTLNSDLDPQQLHFLCVLSEQDEKQFRALADEYALSARGYYRILKVARTLADMEGEASIRFDHVLEAIQFRAEALWAH